MKQTTTLLTGIISCCAFLAGNIAMAGHDYDQNSGNPNGIKHCGTMEHYEMQKQQDPGLELRMAEIEKFTQEWIAKNIKNPSGMSSAVIRIPTVVHVVYANSTQNVSDARVCNQIDRLNLDYRKNNAEATTAIPNIAFASIAADCNIEFCLATKDPQGNPTNGITRTSTTVASWSTNDAVKYTSQGGHDIWDRNKYLNLWVCNLGSGLLGYAQFPGGAAATDGVVVLYSSLPGGAAPYGMGRTATHEVGHWLNLRHIWGDANCGNDQVTDTPPAEGPHYSVNASGPPSGCPTHPYHTNQCGAGTSPNGEMTMNYMDYTDDKCMYMFTTGQSQRMNATLNGTRVSLLTSATSNCSTSTNYPNPPCVTSGVTETFNTSGALNIFPNPSTGEVFLTYDLLNTMELKIYNAIGQAVLTRKITVPSRETKVDLNNNPDGIYLFEVKTPEGTITRKVVLNR
jgi:hypothetical protein